MNDAENGTATVSSVEGTAKDQGLKVGTVVVSINGTSTQGMNKAEVISLVKSAGRPITLRFEEAEGKI